jgi:hypothetical protein
VGPVSCQACRTAPRDRSSRVLPVSARAAFVPRQACPTMGMTGLVLGYGLASQRWITQRASVPANLVASAGLLVVARRWGASCADVGARRTDMGRGLLVGLAVARPFSPRVQVSRPPADSSSMNERRASIAGRSPTSCSCAFPSRRRSAKKSCFAARCWAPRRRGSDHSGQACIAPWCSVCGTYCRRWRRTEATRRQRRSPIAWGVASRPSSRLWPQRRLQASRCAG